MNPPAVSPSPLSPAAVLWDMDGLLVDTEPLWSIAEREVAASWGVAFDPATKAAMMGHRLDESVPIMMSRLGVSADVTAVSRRLLSRMCELFAAGVTPRPGAVALLAALAAAGIPQALVSSSYRVLVDALPAVLRAPFAVTVAGDEVARAKPDPAGYLSAAAALGVAAGDCVVLEDSAAGARAGAAAGAVVVLVPSQGAVRAETGWHVMGSLEEVTPVRLRRLVTPGSRAARARSGRRAAAR